MMLSKNPRFRLGSARGFTLLEILVVLAIIGLLVGVLVTNVGSLFDRGKEDVTKIFVNQSIKTPLERYRMDMGDYPSTADGLQALISGPQNKSGSWRGPYLDTQGAKMPVDPWQRAYQYRYPGTKNKGRYDVFSFGPDGVESEDDIGNW